MQQGRFYFIKDIFFEKFNFQFLMLNHEIDRKGKRHNRPCFYAIEDPEINKIYWLVPLSHKIDKYQKVINQKIKRYGHCETILIEEFLGKSKSAFLFQNMFPIIQKYIDEKYVINNVDVRLPTNLEEKIIKYARLNLNLHKHAIKNIFPDVDKIKKLLEEELQKKS